MPDIGQVLDMLERDQALELQEPLADGHWPAVADDDIILEVDQDRLFPRRPPTDRGERDFDLYGDDWGLSENDAAGILQDPEHLGPHSSVPAPEWDVWAWYQPIHFFGSAWGIYIRESGLQECARRIARVLPPGTDWTPRRNLLAKALIRAALAALFLHEHYHHKTESLALRMHVVERHAVYPSYHHLVYRATKGTSDQIEEGLANADSWYRITDAAYVRWMGMTISRSAREYLKRSFLVAPPGYDNASRLLKRVDYDAEQRKLFGQTQEGRLRPTRLIAADFAIATHLNQSVFNVAQPIWTVVPAGGRSILPTRMPISPLATIGLERFLRAKGWIEVHGAGKGSHRKFKNQQSGRMIILPHAKDVSPPVLKTSAEALGMSMHDLRLLAS